MFEKFNKKGNKFNYNTEGFEYFNLKQLANDSDWGIGEIFTVYGAFIVKSTDPQFKDHPVVILQDRFASLPAHLTPDFKEILDDEDMVRMINDGGFGIEIVPYRKKYKDGTESEIYYTIKYHDLYEGEIE